MKLVIGPKLFRKETKCWLRAKESLREIELKVVERLIFRRSRAGEDDPHPRNAGGAISRTQRRGLGDGAVRLHDPILHVQDPGLFPGQEKHQDRERALEFTLADGGSHLVRFEKVQLEKVVKGTLQAGEKILFIAGGKIRHLAHRFQGNQEVSFGMGEEGKNVDEIRAAEGIKHGGGWWRSRVPWRPTRAWAPAAPG